MDNNAETDQQMINQMLGDMADALGRPPTAVEALSATAGMFSIQRDRLLAALEHILADPFTLISKQSIELARAAIAAAKGEA